MLPPVLREGARHTEKFRLRRRWGKSILVPHFALRGLRLCVRLIYERHALDCQFANIVGERDTSLHRRRFDAHFDYSAWRQGQRQKEICRCTPDITLRCSRDIFHAVSIRHF